MEAIQTEINRCAPLKFVLIKEIMKLGLFAFIQSFKFFLTLLLSRLAFYANICKQDDETFYREQIISLM